MDAKIRYVVLWPKNPKNAIRKIQFSCKGVEVISGWSQKGKSALIHIVDYCLGSEKCAIPVGKVRDMVEWFGVVLLLPKGRQLLLARRNPGDAPESSDMVWLEGRKLSIPDSPERTDSRSQVVERLNQLAGLPSRGSNDEEGSSFDGPPSFRDMAAFNFQPQHIIANPYTLFFKADTSIHREKLVRSVLPYVLGAVDADTLNAQAELRRFEQELRLKKEELEQCQRASAMWMGQLQNFFSVARQYGLLSEAIEPHTDWTVDVYVALLRSVPDKWKEHPIFVDVPGMSRRASRELSALQQEEIRLNREIQDGERKARKLDSLRDDVEGYTSALDRQQERLLPVGWLASRISEDHSCPICGSSSNSAQVEAQRLSIAAKTLGEFLSASTAANDSLDTESRHLQESIDKLKGGLLIVENRIQDWEQKYAELKDARSRRDYLNQFVGQLKAIIESIDAGSPHSKIQKKVEELTKRVANLLRQVNPVAIRERTDIALKKISDSISTYAKLLGVGHSDQKWELDDRNLTLTSRRARRIDYLWEIGSAANWMGFHVAALLALHEHFRTVAHNPVPKFLIIDQPSQAFFPEGIVATTTRRARQEPHPRISDDLARLKRLFMALAAGVAKTQGGLQIILLEHAEPSTWEGIPNFSMPDGEWREQNALVPLDWE